MNDMLKIVPSLWFDKETEEAVNFYISVFNGSPHKGRDSKIISLKRYEKGMEVPGADQMEGKVLTAIFELNGQRFMALDGGPLFKFNEAVSFEIRCDSQEEVDHYWSRLTEGGDVNAQQCGWLKDKFGVSWQVVPQALVDLMSDPDHVKTGRVMNAMLQMKKIDVAGLQRAYEGK